MKHGRRHSEDEDESAQPKAFAVDGELPPEAGPPQNGLDFLRHVRWETKRIPAVVVAPDSASSSERGARDGLHVQLSVFSADSGISEDCDPTITPSREWEVEFVDWFSHHRDRVAAALRSISSASAATSSRDWAALCSGPPPSLSALASFDHMSVVSALESLSEQCPAAALTRGHLLWIFALLTILDKPLEAETASSIRTLLRSCCSRRRDIAPSDPIAIALNIVIAVAGLYFNQLGRPS